MIIIMRLKGMIQDIYLTAAKRPLQHTVCHVVPRDSLAIKFDRVEIAFISKLYCIG